MFYQLNNNFTEIKEPAGIIQNLSPFTLEVSATNTPNSGELLQPRQVYLFNAAPIYARCVESGTAKVRVITAGYSTSCCDTNMLCSCGGNSGGNSGGDSNDSSGGTIEKIIVDGKTQTANGGTVTLDLSGYLKGHETVTRAEVHALFT